MNMSTDHLTKTIGMWIKNHKGAVLGKVEEIKFDKTRHVPTYLILCCTELAGNSNRYFAIPATPSLIETNQDGDITLRVDKKVLQIVMGVPANKHPEFNAEASNSIFELYGYEN